MEDRQCLSESVCVRCARKRSFHNAILRKEQGCSVSTFLVWKTDTQCPASTRLRNSPVRSKSRCTSSSTTDKNHPICQISRSVKLLMTFCGKLPAKTPTCFPSSDAYSVAWRMVIGIRCFTLLRKWPTENQFSQNYCLGAPTRTHILSSLIQIGSLCSVCL